VRWPIETARIERSVALVDLDGEGKQEGDDR
jgi:hypothetical protein